jgi:hypothetical protein
MEDHKMHRYVRRLDRWEGHVHSFLVNCPRGTMFIKFIDASPYVKDAQLLCELLDNFIREIGLQYVVQVNTDNAANYDVANKLLMER